VALILVGLALWLFSIRMIPAGGYSPIWLHTTWQSTQV
jgi:hypothetical protein